MGFSQPCQTSNMERFAKIANGFQPLTIFAKHSILDVWQSSENTHEDVGNLFSVFEDYMADT